MEDKSGTVASREADSLIAVTKHEYIHILTQKEKWNPKNIASLDPITHKPSSYESSCAHHLTILQSSHIKPCARRAPGPMIPGLTWVVSSCQLPATSWGPGLIDTDFEDTLKSNGSFTPRGSSPARFCPPSYGHLWPMRLNWGATLRVVASGSLNGKSNSPACWFEAHPKQNGEVDVLSTTAGKLPEDAETI